MSARPSRKFVNFGEKKFFLAYWGEHLRGEHRESPREEVPGAEARAAGTAEAENPAETMKPRDLKLRPKQK